MTLKEFIWTLQADPQTTIIRICFVGPKKVIAIGLGELLTLTSTACPLVGDDIVVVGHAFKGDSEYFLFVKRIYPEED